MDLLVGEHDARLEGQGHGWARFLSETGFQP
jgi:hypothetical protein